jgi:uncharacterized protein (DUF305 family)
MHRRRTAVLLIAAAATAVLAGCGSRPSTSSGTGSAAPTSAAAAASATDVTFAQLMIPHHLQAVVMADLALDAQSGASAKVRSFAGQIKAAQAPEIEQMIGWLEAWGAPSEMPSAPADDHSGHDMAGMTEHGMMTDDDLAALEVAHGRGFDAMWLRMMIEHHEGAVLMAEQVKVGTTDPEVVDLANSIIATQTEEIKGMRKALP